MAVMAQNSSKQAQIPKPLLQENNPKQNPINSIPKIQESVPSQPGNTMLAGPVKEAVKEKIPIAEEMNA